MADNQVTTLKKSGPEGDYLHGFGHEEQDRLYRQARGLAARVFERTPFQDCRKLLEIGCGVGAQTEILLERFPNVHITGIDASALQLARATRHHASNIKDGRVQFLEASATRLPFESREFDGAFVCWLLEHVTEPLEVLKEARRVLAPGSPIHCVAVFNSSLFIDPMSDRLRNYWKRYNERQLQLKGDPDFGARLGAVLDQAGFSTISVQAVNVMADRRDREHRDQTLRLWKALLLSGADGLVKNGDIPKELPDELSLELDQLIQNPEALLSYTWFDAVAIA